MIPLGDVDRRPARAPVVTRLVVLACVVVFALEIDGGEDFVRRWSVIPSEVLAGRGVVTVLTSMFLHGGFGHIVGNLLFFWTFGPPIEGAMGHGRFLVFYVVGGLVAMLAQVLADPGATTPLLGASGAIAAVMGAFLVTFPGDRIRTVLIFGFLVRVAFVPAIVLVGIWFLLQVLAEVGGAAGGVAYVAHIAGFVVGMGLARPFEGRRAGERRAG